jgi:hypothetical protein
MVRQQDIWLKDYSNDGIRADLREVFINEGTV